MTGRGKVARDRKTQTKQGLIQEESGGEEPTDTANLEGETLENPEASRANISTADARRELLEEIMKDLKGELQSLFQQLRGAPQTTTIPQSNLPAPQPSGI